MDALLPSPVTVRDCTAADIPAITRIYGHWVRHSFASMEEEPPDAAEMARRHAALLEAEYPFIVAVDLAGTVVGYAYAGPYRSRLGYRFAAEDSIYVAPSAAGRGIGRTLLEALLLRTEVRGIRQMIAVIGSSTNAASVALHLACGFRHAGLLPGAGWKHGCWVDSVLMTRAIGLGTAAPPRETTPP